MDEKKKNIPLKLNLQKDEIQIPVSTEPEGLPFRLLNDESDERHSLGTDTCNQIISQGAAAIHPLDERSLDSVFEYTNKIRLFLGLRDEPANCGPSVDSNSDIVNSKEFPEIQPKEETHVDEVSDEKIDPVNVVDILISSSESNHISNDAENIFPEDEHDILVDSIPVIPNSEPISEIQPKEETDLDQVCGKKIDSENVVDTLINSCDRDIFLNESKNNSPGEVCDVKIDITNVEENNTNSSERDPVFDKSINICSEKEHNLSSVVLNTDIVNSEQISESQSEEGSYVNELRNGEIDTTNFENSLISSCECNNISKEAKNISTEDEHNLETNTEPDDINGKIDTYNITCPSPEKADRVPNIAAIRRLSTEIVSKVLDTAENKLKDMLSNQRKSVTNDKGCFLNVNIKTGRNFVEDTMRTENFAVGNNFQQNGDRGISVLSGLCTYQPFQNSDGCENNKFKNEIQLKDVLAKTYSAYDFQKKIEIEMNKFDPRYDVDPDTICGIGSFKPKWIQKYATSRMYLVLYSIIGILSGSYYAYLISCMSTIEKRFAFKSKISGSIMVVDEITPLVLGVFVGYFGGKSHRPRMVGFGMFLASICCFISALPYFIYGPATHLSVLSKHEKSVIDLCDGENHGQDCDSDSLPPTLAAVLLLMLGSFLKGFGNLAYYAVGLTYMDDNAKKKNTPMYFAVAIALRLLGPFLGFLMSSFFLKFHENPFGDPGFGRDDPRWIGGWWMGFLLQGVLLFLFTIPITLFPRRLPGHKKPSSTDTNEKGLKSNAIGLFAALKRLGKNPLFVLMNLNFIMIIFGNFGHYMMLPKYMENQFRLSASDASLFSGPPPIVSVIISTLIGGYLIWKFKPSPRFLIGSMIILEVISVVGYLLLMIPRCEHVEMTSFGSSNDWLVLEDTCNANCNCSSSIFNPVCGPEGENLFYSPCYAGCKNNLNHSFSNCSCLSNQTESKRDFVTDGFCVNKECWSQALTYLVSMPIIALITNLCKVAHSMLLLRCVHPNDKSIAMGTFEALICLFGFIPYPVLFGALVDSACLVWENSCGQRGNCWYYDAPTFNLSLHGVSASFTAVSVFCLCAIYYYSGRLEKLYDDDDDVEIENLTEIKEKSQK